MIRRNKRVQRSKTIHALLRAGFALAMTSGYAAAQVSVYNEQGKLFRAPDSITTLGSNLFGDKVNLYTGNLEFVQMDVSLAGNNALPVAVGRRLRTGSAGVDGALFGRWDLEIPHLHGTFSQLRKWSASGAVAGARCSSFGAPPTVSGSSGSNSTWVGTEYWNGSFLYVPGIGDQELLKRSATNTQKPADAYAYPVVTRDNWALRCLATMAPGNPETGEAFVAVSPDGTHYQFDWLVWRNIPQLSKTSTAPEGSVAASAPEAASLDSTEDGNERNVSTKKLKPGASPTPSIVDGHVLGAYAIDVPSG